MDKVIFNDSQPALLEKVASQMTLVENNNQIKSASDNNSIREMMTDLKPDKDHFMVHLVALGDHEHYGWNRNGDTFPKEACQKYVDTFVKHGFYFREHKNQDPKYKIGDVKTAAYNEPMGRIELIIHGNKNLCPDIYETVKEGKSRSFSMSCTVPYDISSITGKKQASVADYDKYCKHRMGQYIPEFKKYAYVINDKPKWFDISDVAHPADRIAHYLDYMVDESMGKAASAQPALSADLAQKFPVRQLENTKTGCKSVTHQKILHTLADAEEYINAIYNAEDLVSKDEKYEFVKGAANFAWNDAQLSDQEVEKLRRLKPGTMFNLLAKRATFLPFESFCACVSGDSLQSIKNSEITKYANCCALPSLFQKLMNTPINEMEELFEPSSDFEVCSDPAHNDEIDKIMQEAEEKFSVDAKPLKQRVYSITIIQGGKPKEKVKSASTQEFNLTQKQKQEAENLALAYGYYKIATVKKINEIKGENFVDSSKNLLIIKQHNQ